MELLSLNGIIILAMVIYDNFLLIYKEFLFQGEEALRYFYFGGMLGSFLLVLEISIISLLLLFFMSGFFLFLS